MCRGAGATITLSTPSGPTVTPSVAANLTGTGNTVANVTGSATYQYQIVALTQDRGYTVASPATSITRGAASLGSQTVSISSWTRARNIVTVTTSKIHGLVAGAMVYINGGTGTDGYFVVDTAPTGTTFTMTTGLDTRNGAAASGGAVGRVVWYNCNKITWSAVTNAYQYIIYGRVSGLMLPLGFSYPQNTSISNVATYNEYEDYGPNMSAPGSFPDWVPASPPAVAKNGDLVTTILRGAGSPSVTLAANAGNSVTAATFKLDNTPNIAAAMTVAAAGATRGVLYIPAEPSLFFVTNSILAVPALNLSVVQLGMLVLGDTLILRQTQWTGQPPNPINRPQFGYMALPQIGTSTAYPMLYSKLGPTTLDYVNLNSSSANQSVLYLSDGGSGIPADQLDHVTFITGGNSDYLSLHYVVRGNDGGAKFSFRYCEFLSGPAQVGGATATPLVYFDGSTNGGVGGQVIFEHTMMNRRGILFRGGASLFTAKYTYEQGGIAPLFTFANPLGFNANTNGIIDSTIQDTMATPLLTILSSNMPGEFKISNTAGPSPGTPLVSGFPVSLSLDGVTSNVIIGQNIFVTSGPTNTTVIDGTFSNQANAYAEETHDAAIAIGTPYKAFVVAATQTAPSCSVSLGGTVAVGPYNFTVAPVFPDGSEGTLSPPSNTCTTSVGNQTIAVGWTTVPGAIGYDLYRNGFSFQCTPPWVNGTTSSYTWSGQTACGVSAPSSPGGGPTYLNSGGVGAKQITLSAANGGGTTAISAPSNTANRTVPIPDASGNMGLTSGVLTHIDNPTVTRGDGTTQATLITPMAATDYFNRANGAITLNAPQWVVQSGGWNISSNQVTAAGGSQNSVVYTGVTFTNDDQTVCARHIQLGSIGSANHALTVRASTSVQTAYELTVANGLNAIGIGKIVAGSFTGLARMATGDTVASGDLVCLNVIGTTLTGYWNGKQVVQTMDSSIASGNPGLWGFNTSANLLWDDFMASPGAVSLNVAQTWTALQSFTSGVTSSAYSTSSNCSSTSSPAVCGSAAGGSVVIAASATTVTVNTTAVTANSQIVVTEDSSLGTKLSVTCNTTTGRTYAVTRRSAGTSFVIAASAAPTTTPACLSYVILN